MNTEQGEDRVRRVHVGKRACALRWSEEMGLLAKGTLKGRKDEAEKGELAADRPPFAKVCRALPH